MLWHCSLGDYHCLYQFNYCPTRLLLKLRKLKVPNPKKTFHECCTSKVKVLTQWKTCVHTPTFNEIKFIKRIRQPLVNQRQVVLPLKQKQLQNGNHHLIHQYFCTVMENSNNLNHMPYLIIFSIHPALPCATLVKLLTHMCVCWQTV